MRDRQGRFLPGPDQDRHPLTDEERRRGYANAMERLSHGDAKTYAWLWRRVRSHFRAKARFAPC